MSIEGHHIASDDEPVREPHPEFGDVTDADTEFAVSDDDRPDLVPSDDESAATMSPADELYEAAPTENPNDDIREEAAMLDSDSQR